MHQQNKTTYSRVNVTLPAATLKLVDKIAVKRGRSKFLHDAVQYYIKERGEAVLREQLKRGALYRAERDTALAEEWFPIDEQVWSKRKK